jgi:hypothetical protein
MAGIKEINPVAMIYGKTIKVKVFSATSGV